jgi:hypothetical protein
MTKITGNEAVNGIPSWKDDGAFPPLEGIPVRLHIAANIMAHDPTPSTNAKLDAESALNRADALIMAYNNTPNPNE